MRRFKPKIKAVLTALVLTVTITAPSMQATSQGSTTNETISVEYFYSDGTMEAEEIPNEFYYDPNAEYSPTRFEDFKDVDGVVDLTADTPVSDKSIIITIMGDGFTQSEQDSFITESQKVKGQLFAIYPYSEFKEQIKVYAIKIVSKDSMMGTPYRTPVMPYPDTYFSTYIYDDGRDKGQMMNIRDLEKARNLRSSFYAEYGLKESEESLSVVLHNNISTECGVAVYKDKYGIYTGFAVSAICPDPNQNGNNTGDVVAHELGHSFGNLRDEYGNKYEESANMTRVSDLDKIRWKPFIGIDDIGIHLVGGWYIPVPDKKCKMSATKEPFCEVCASELTRKFAEITAEDFYGYRESLYINLDRSYDIISKPFSEKIISDSATRIVDYAFFGRKDLYGITIPDYVTSIGRYSFLRCTGLTDLFIPKSVTHIEDTAFFGCENLKIYGYAGSSAEVYALNNDFPFVEISAANRLSILDKQVLGVFAPLGKGEADLNGDGVIDVFDTVLVRQTLN